MKNSHEWIDKIIAALFAPEKRRIDKMVEDLNRKNSEIKKKVFHGFIHLGERYIPGASKPQMVTNRRMQIPMPSLAFELNDEASAFISDVRKVQLDEDQIRQVLFKLLHQANSLQEIRDSLPDSVVPLVPEIAQLNRCTENPTWFIRNDARALKMYEKMLPKIEMYAISRLIY